MRFILMMGLLIATSTFAGETTLKTIVLEECYRDQNYDDRLIELAHRFGTNGFRWDVANYNHTFLHEKKLLVVAVNDFGQVYDREITTKEIFTKHFSRIADYAEVQTANNHQTQKSRLVADIDRFLLARKILQCE